MARVVALWLAYDGTDFHGWQHQPGLRTVQGVLEAALLRVIRHPIDLAGSGRTDAGVHAVGQVASFATSNPLPPEKLCHAIGSRLAVDLSIATVREVHPEFNARRSSMSKLYRYRIWNARSRPVERLAQRYTYHYWHPLELEAMREGARYFIGEQDFAAMAARGSRAKTTIRTVIRCDISRTAEELRVEVEGTGFLYNQVRNMVGTLLNVGVGRWPPQRVREVLQGRDRSKAGPTVPARGLCLEWVRYPPHLLQPPDA
jgi:tRNA pseudouridine38-40 synthase